MDIKMGTRPTVGITPTVIHTGNVKEAPILVSTKIGMEERLSNLDKIDQIVPDKKIEIDKFQFSEILKACAEDLMVPRKLNINGKDETIVLLNSYNSNNYIFEFNHNINFINEILKLNLNELDSFLSNFLYTNINTYSFNLFGAIPEILPLVSMDNISELKVLISIH
jgi:hypothetical protein